MPSKGVTLTHLRPRSSDMRLAELPRLVGPDPVPVPVPWVGCALFGLLLRPDATLEAFVCIVKSQPLEPGGEGERTVVERTTAGGGVGRGGHVYGSGSERSGVLTASNEPVLSTLADLSEDCVRLRLEKDGRGCKRF